MSRTDSTPADRPEFTIVDLRSGRGLGGHCFDYLMALKSAFAARDFAVISPYVAADPPPNNRRTVYLRGFTAYRKAIADRGVGVVHNSSMNDYLCLAAAALTTRPSRRGRCLMMLYRDPSIESFGAGGHAVNRVMIWLIRRLIRSGTIWPASDSAIVLAKWLEATSTADGSVVPTPPMPAQDESGGTEVELPLDAYPLVVIPGRMRSEKGAANYPVVARAVLDHFPNGVIALQTAGSDSASAQALAQLTAEFADERRVLMIDQHLSARGYGNLLKAAKVAVLPYDTVAYGAGSSGVVGDSLDSGAVVVSSPIEWVVREYGDDPRVVLAEDPTSVDSIGDAIERALAIDPAVHRGARDADEFGTRWNAAVDAVIDARPGHIGTKT